MRINGEIHYLWRAVDHEGEVLETFVTKRRDRKAALKFLRKAMKRYGNPLEIVTDRLRSYRAATKVIGNEARQATGRWLNNRAETRINRSGAESERWRSSGVPGRYRNSPPFMHRFTTTSTRNVTCTAERFSNSTVPLLSHNGGNCVRLEARASVVLSSCAIYSDNAVWSGVGDHRADHPRPVSFRLHR